MSRTITGNSYKYIIDESYGINKDGFIAIGTESIVYKGLKVMFSGSLQFSCVLKFKPKTQIIDGRKVDCLEKFKTEEWKIFEELRECRSVVRVDDVVGDLGDFSLICPHIDSGVIDASSYYCVIEEFIDGWNLDEYCQEEYWKLRRYEPLDNGLKREVGYNEYSKAEKAAILASYNYDNQLKYQNQILLFMINLCEIMEFVTEQKNILHLDIKPENIMVTRYGKELVLIDFGRSKRVTVADRFASSGLDPIDYNQGETQEKQYEFGALGYAAPECFCEAAEGSEFPFSYSGQLGRMSLESDIFSFGATFWECLNMFELITRSGSSKFDIYDFYKDNFLNDNAYCNRDFQKLSEIAKDCISFAPANRVNDTYDKIVKFTYQNNGSISDYEAAMIVEIITQLRDDSHLPERVDEIMLHADTGSFRAISSEIVKLDVAEECTGYELATAIYNVEVSKTGVLEAYDILQKYKENTDFINAVIKLKNVLDNDDNIALIMESTGQTRQEVLDFFNSIVK